MERRAEYLRGKPILKAIPFNVVFCTIIAVLLYVFRFAPEGKEPNFMHHFVFSQAVGNLCCIFIMIVIHRHKSVDNRIFILFVFFSLVMGAVLGGLISSIILGINPLWIAQEYGFALRILFGTILFGSVITYFWHSHYKIIKTQTMAHEERIKRLSSEKEVAEANLKLLQAQIEPHFLFNTLSNILSLLDTDLEKGKSMLTDLTRYLRASLPKIRKEKATMGEEMALIRDYLKIFQVRMGHWLKVRMDLPDHLKEAVFPPMLLQPMVENAVKHGLEPKVDGGMVSISVSKDGDCLRLEVADTGLGLRPDGGPGTGLTNVKERLSTLYGEKGKLILEENMPSGLKAIIEIPYEKNHSHHS